MFIRDLFRGLPQRGSCHRPMPLGPRPHGQWPLDRPLVELAPGDAFTVRDCVSGVQIFGGTGSGKTSGSLALLAQAMLRDEWGMLVLTTKRGEAEQWEGWAGQNERGQDVLRIRPGDGHHFNFLDYLNRHPDPGASVATNIADMLMTLAQHSRPKEKASETSQFFAESASRMATQAIHLLRDAGEPLTLEGIGQVISSAPTHPLEMEEERFGDSLLPRLLRQAQDRGSTRVRGQGDYWLREFPSMNERTRGDVIATLTTVIYRFTEQPIRDLIASSQGSTYIPDSVDAGRIMILDCPIVSYLQAGRLFQIAIKLLVQQAIVRRMAADTTRPVAIFADEAQNFATHSDYAYQAICRDFRGCTIYATQSIDNYLEAVGSDAAVEALLASLVTKIFHANAGRTNEWAEKLIAGDWRQMSSESLNQQGDRGRHSFGMSESEQVHPQVLASEFTRLRTGGVRNGGIVDAIVFQMGRRFRQTGKPILRTAFLQDGVAAMGGRS